MAKSSSRSGRLSDLLQRELSKLISSELSHNASIGMITISGVEVSEDLANARVYVTILQDDKRQTSINALNDSAGFFRSTLSKQLSLRVVPKIRFIYDESLNNGYRLDQLLASVKDPNHDERD